MGSAYLETDHPLTFTNWKLPRGAKVSSGPPIRYYDLLPISTDEIAAMDDHVQILKA